MDERLNVSVILVYVIFGIWIEMNAIGGIWDVDSFRVLILLLLCSPFGVQVQCNLSSSYSCMQQHITCPCIFYLVDIYIYTPTLLFYR